MVCVLRAHAQSLLPPHAGRLLLLLASVLRLYLFFLKGGDYEKTITERNEAHFVAVSALLPLLPAEPVLPLLGVTALPRTPAHRHAALRLSLLDPRSCSRLLALVLCVAFLEYDRLRDSNSGSIRARRFFISRLRLGSCRAAAMRPLLDSLERRTIDRLLQLVVLREQRSLFLAVRALRALHMVDPLGDDTELCLALPLLFLQLLDLQSHQPVRVRVFNVLRDI